MCLHSLWISHHKAYKQSVAVAARSWQDGYLWSPPFSLANALTLIITFVGFSLPLSLSGSVWICVVVVAVVFVNIRYVLVLYFVQSSVCMILYSHSFLNPTESFYILYAMQCIILRDIVLHGPSCRITHRNLIGNEFFSLNSNQRYVCLYVRGCF